MKIALIALLSVGLALAAPQSHISSDLLSLLENEPSTNIIISFKKTDLEAVRAQYARATYADRTTKIEDMKNRLRRHSEEVAGDVIRHLQKARSGNQRVELIWVTNQVVVYHADLALVQSLAPFTEISEVRKTKLYPGPAPLDVKPYVGPKLGEQWGVIDTHAHLCHGRNITGAGVVVGIIDTGVRYRHEALRDNHRANYYWYEPESPTAAPHDTVGHGTHVTGNIAGRHNGIGVAHDAQWIHCLGCRSSGCTEEALLGCGQWAVCPVESDGTREDCSKAPHVVSNSWGGGNEDPFYDVVIRAWVDADIVPVFAIGNSGPNCATANSPGDGELPIGVGSINNQRHTSSFSSRGPTARTNRIKPDCAAPGTDVVSSYYLSDTSYYTMSGTSMATPHVAGIVALLRSAAKLTVAEVKQLIRDYAVPHAPVPTAPGCDGISPREYPNHQVGHGLLQCDTLIDGLIAQGKYTEKQLI